MSNRTDAGTAVVATIVTLLVLFLAVGGGIYYVLRSRQMMAQAELAEMADAQRQAEQALLQARATAVSRTSPQRATKQEEADDSVRAAVEVVLRTQERAWNDGDLDAFMEHYWKSDALTFSAGGDTTRGWTATLNRYRERYPTREAMGRLTLSEFEIASLGDSAALALGKWRVERDSDPLTGNFTLVARLIEGRWVVVHDHTSRKSE